MSEDDPKHSPENKPWTEEDMASAFEKALGNYLISDNEETTLAKEETPGAVNHTSKQSHYG